MLLTIVPFLNLVMESASGNWFADVIHHAYDDSLRNMGYDGADGVFLCAGALRGDSVYGPGDYSYHWNLI